MEENFNIALTHLWKAEGGYINHTSDRGHETNMGITRAALERYRGHTVTSEDVKNLSRKEATAIYRRDYWEANGFDQIENPRVAAVLFDQIVNRRASEVIRSLQVILAKKIATDLEIDGILGPLTAQALNKAPPGKLIIAMVIEAQKSYFAIVERAPAQKVFLKGWIARTWSLLKMA